MCRATRWGLAAVPSSLVPGVGTGAALRTVEQAIAKAGPHPEAVHHALRDRFPDLRSIGHPKTPSD